MLLNRTPFGVCHLHEEYKHVRSAIRVIVGASMLLLAAMCVVVICFPMPRGQRSSAVTQNLNHKETINPNKTTHLHFSITPTWAGHQ